METLRAKFETVEAPDGDHHIKKKNNAKKSQSSTKCNAAFFKRLEHFVRLSRYAGIPLAVLYGFFIFYYMTFFLLSDPPEAVTANLGKSNGSSEFANVNCDFSFEPTTKPDHMNISSNMSGPTTFGVDNYIVGAASGGVVCVTMGVTSIFSKRTRCSMMLIIPTLFAGRGRAFILTAAMGLLLDGPINSINYNVEQIVASLTCMYSQMKIMACRFRVNFESVFGQVAAILESLHADLQKRLKRISKEVEQLTGEAKRKALEAKRETERQLADLQKKLDGIKDVIEAPGNILNGACNGIKSAISATGDFFKNDVGGFFSNLFGRRRRKRSAGCGIPPVLPNVDVNIPGVDLEALKKWAKDMFPDVDFLDLNLDDFSNVLKGQSISNIRLKMINILKEVFNLVQQYSFYLKKLFYILSLVLVTVDAFNYMRTYYSDDSFDNMYVDSNLRDLWKDKPDKKLTPLRQWELAEKYQVSSSLKLTKKEIKRIFIQASPTIVFVVITICTVVADLGLKGLLDLILENGQYGISFEGMEQNLDLGSLLSEVQNGQTSLASLKLKGFDLSTEPCLPRALQTSNNSLAWLGALITVCLVSCIFDAYACRWRAQICNLFYEVRAKERADYLYRRIKAGRGNRRFQLRLVVLRELRRRQRIAEYSCCQCLKRNVINCTTCNKASSVLICPGCNLKVDKTEARSVTFTEGGQMTVTDICSDCDKDK